MLQVKVMSRKNGQIYIEHGCDLPALRYPEQSDKLPLLLHYRVIIWQFYFILFISIYFGSIYTLLIYIHVYIIISQAG